MAGNIPNPRPETSQFSSSRMQDNVAPTSGQQVFATAQWRPKEPPMFTGATTDDVYLWTSLVNSILCSCAEMHIKRLHSQQPSFVEQPMSGIWATKGVMGTDHPGIGLP